MTKLWPVHVVLINKNKTMIKENLENIGGKATGNKPKR